MFHLGEVNLETTREVVMARLARQIGRGRDAIYHGTRHLPEVLRDGKLKPPQQNSEVYFTRSPEVAAYWALQWGMQVDGFSGGGVLVLDRALLMQNYRLEPSRYDENGWDEREEHVWGRWVSFRRHLLGVVREADVYAIIGTPRHRYLPPDFLTMPEAKRQAFWDEVKRPAHTLVSDGTAKVRETIIQERAHRGNAAQSTGLRG